MKTIFLMRHGKSEDGYDKTDFERDLHPKGEKKTLKIARFLLEQHYKPQKIITSAAYRTIQTAKIMSKVLGIPDSDIIETKQLYLASADEMLSYIYGIDDSINSIMMVGHNHGISDLASYLSHSDLEWMSTSAVVAVEIDSDKWTYLELSTKTLLFNIKPSLI